MGKEERERKSAIIKRKKTREKINIKGYWKKKYNWVEYIVYTPGQVFLQNERYLCALLKKSLEAAYVDEPSSIPCNILPQEPVGSGHSPSNLQKQITNRDDNF